MLYGRGVGVSFEAFYGGGGVVNVGAVAPDTSIRRHLFFAELRLLVQITVFT